jgi:ribosome-binding factor A
MPSKHQQTSGRHGRIEAQMQRVLSELISREVKDPRVGNVTITAVQIAHDLATARIYFVPFAGGHDPVQVAEGLARAGGFLRGAVGRQLGLRHAPRLSFEFDETLDKAAHLTDLINRAVASDTPPKPDET